MTPEPPVVASPRLIRAARIALVLLGVPLIGIGLVAETNQAPLIVSGALVLAAAAAGQRLVRWYRPAALLLLTTALLLAVLEIGATAVVSLARTPSVQARLARIIGPAHDLVDHYLSLPYYAAQPWSGAYWAEHRRAVRQRYEPYVLWSNPPFRGEQINVDGEGRRVVPGARCVEGAWTVFVYGGSAMWGWGSPDWGTIPAYLQRELEAARAGPVCVVNRAENAFVAAQNLIRLEADLVAGRVPDLVLFYDGVNELLAADRSGRAWAHQNVPEIAARFEGGGSPLAAWLRGRSLPYLADKLAAWMGGGVDPREAPPGMPETAELGGRVVEAYLAIADMASDLGARYGFETHFVWQPHILAGAKPLAPEERRMIEELNWLLDLDGRTREIFRTAYGRAETEASARPDLHWAAAAFDGVEDAVWIDTWGHVTPAGNERVARWIVADLGLSAR